jgi:DNA-damage-inducible protein J
MFLQQIVRERAVPLSLSLDSSRAVYADLLAAQNDRAQGYVGRSADDVLADMRSLIERVEQDG